MITIYDTAEDISYVFRNNECVATFDTCDDRDGYLVRGEGFMGIKFFESREDIVNYYEEG